MIPPSAMASGHPDLRASYPGSFAVTALEMRASKPSMPVRPVRSLADTEMLTVIIDFAIGSLVPSWYRAAPAEPASTAAAPQMTTLRPEHEPGLGG